MENEKCGGYFAKVVGKKGIGSFWFILGILFFMNSTISSQDLPNPPANMETVSAGTYVIPMDNVNQSIQIYPSPPIAPYQAFNIKAYGLIYKLLEKGIPVKWVIRAGKERHEPDFSAYASQVFPTSTPSTNFDFGGGTFVVEANSLVEEVTCNPDNPTTLPDIETIISTYGHQVAVFKLTDEIAVDVRYTLRFAPKVAVMEDGGFHFEQTEVFDAAEIPYDVLSNQAFLNTSECFTFVAQPHIEAGLVDQNYVNVLSNFVQNGGNFFAQCVGLLSYENLASFQTTFGLVNVNPDIENANYFFLNDDLPIMQFQGDFPDNISGLTTSFGLATGSSWNTNAYKGIVVGSNPNNNEVILSGADINGAIPGGNMFYGGGHAYNSGPIVEEYPNIPNARRILLNAVFVPANINFACAGNDVCVCIGESTVLGCSTPVNGTSFTWSPAAGLSCTNCPNPIASPETTTTYTMTPGNSTCGSSTVTVTVWDDGPQAINVEQDCNALDTEYVLSFNILGGDPSSYEINGDPGTLSGTSFVSDPIIAGDPYSFEVTDEQGCVFPVEGVWNCCPALATISGGGTICEGSLVDVIVQLDGNGPWSFVYAIDGSTQPPITAMSSPYILEASIPGVYTLVSVEDSDCLGNALGGINVNEYDFGDAGTNASYSLCYNADPISLWPDMGSADRDGVWSLSSGNQVGNPLDQTTGEFDPYKQKEGFLVYNYIVSGQGICPDDTSVVTIEILDCPCIAPAPLSRISQDIILCEELETEVILKVRQAPKTRAMWYDSPDLDNLLHVGGSYSVTGPGVFYVIAANIPNDECYSNPLILSYVLSDSPVISTIEDTTLTTVEPIKLVTSAYSPSGAALSYEWFDLNDEISWSTELSPLVYPNTSNTYTIIVTDEFGCAATTSVNINFINNVYFPNAITPNLDGINDVFRPYGEGIATMTLRVFNRWGSLVYNKTTSNLSDGWDGTMNNKKLSSGVYLYRAEIRYFSGEVSKHSGGITLIR